MAGRKSRFSSEMERALCDARRAGKTDQEACTAVGIYRGTLYDWLRRGDRGEAPYVSLAIAYRAAAADRVRQCIREAEERARQRLREIESVAGGAFQSVAA